MCAMARNRATEVACAEESAIFAFQIHSLDDLSSGSLVSDVTHVTLIQNESLSFLRVQRL